MRAAGGRRETSSPRGGWVTPRSASAVDVYWMRVEDAVTEKSGSLSLGAIVVIYTRERGSRNVRARWRAAGGSDTVYLPRRRPPATQPPPRLGIGVTRAPHESSRADVLARRYSLFGEPISQRVFNRRRGDESAARCVPPYRPQLSRVGLPTTSVDYILLFSGRRSRRPSAQLMTTLFVPFLLAGSHRPRGAALPSASFARCSRPGCGSVFRELVVITPSLGMIAGAVARSVPRALRRRVDVGTVRRRGSAARW